jgi:predicted GNAT family N-acyltransferase
MGNVLSLCQSIYEQNFNINFELKWSDIYIKIKNGTYTLLVLHHHYIIGLSLISNYNKNYHIDYLCINNHYKGQGYGKLLFKKTILYCKNYSKPVTLECEKHLIPFYQNLGCSFTGIYRNYHNKIFHLLFI